MRKRCAALLLVRLTGRGQAIAPVRSTTHNVRVVVVLTVVLPAAFEADLVPATLGLAAGAAADREALGPLGIDVDRFFSLLAPATLDRSTRREPLLPLGAAKARRQCALMNPPLGLDAQAIYEASLRLALARREREHRPEHLALCLVALDPGAAWVLKTSGADTRALLADLTLAFPSPRRNLPLRAERRIDSAHAAKA
jgi:hypothetical protein